MLTLEDCVKIGVFLRPHGVNGTLILAFDPEWEVPVGNASVLFVETDGLPVPWFLVKDSIRFISSQTALVDLEWIEDQQTAKKLCGNNVYIEKTTAFKTAETGMTDWKGFTLLNTSGMVIGTIIATEDYAGNRVMLVDTPTGEKMVPFHIDLIRGTDSKHHKITMEFPEGLMDI